MKRAVPVRLCIGCGGRDAQSRLLRFTVGAGGKAITLEGKYGAFRSGGQCHRQSGISGVRANVYGRFALPEKAA